MEELNVRSIMALTQKRFIQEIEFGDGADDDELLKMTAQVVSSIVYFLTCALDDTWTSHDTFQSFLQDKLTLKYFSAMVDANKVERALDLVDRLHLEVSYNLAIQLAGRHDKLADAIERARDVKFSDEEDPNNEEEDPESPGATTYLDHLKGSRQVSPDVGHSSKMKRDMPTKGSLFQHMESKRQRHE